MKKLILLAVVLILSAKLFADFVPVRNSFSFNAYSQEEDSYVSAAFLNKEITEDSRITVGEDGHLYAAGKRLRIFGTNLSEFPSKADAPFAAKNLATQGYNCIRFHHTDANWTHCFLKQLSSGKWVINKERLDDFDFFFAELKKAGIYSNINLLTGRSMSAADGFPKDIEKSSEMKGPHSLGFWDEKAREYQKQYAFDLLTHVNPYTGLSYCEDPAVAIVEINNENGLLMAYLNGWIDDYKDSVYWKELEDQWNEWLNNQELNYESLADTYNKGTSVLSTILEPNKAGHLEQHQGATAQLTQDKNTHKIYISKNGQSGWHVQYSFPGLKIKSNKFYTIKFSAKASDNCKINVGLSQSHDPWKNAGFNTKINLTKQFQDFEFVVTDQLSDDNIRLIFSDMGLLQGKTIYLKDIKLLEGGILNVVKKSDDKNVIFPDSQEYKTLPADYKNLLMSFMWEKELDYWTSMKSYIKDELNSKALLMGTAMGCSTTCIQNIFDIIDSHAYWNHPSFPGKGWDTANYSVHNNSLTKAKDNPTLTNLAKYRVYGKPFSVSEYDHPYPNQFSAEAYPMLSSFAAFQDWDCIFTFCSELPKASEIKTLKTSGYFDQSGNPVKSCAASFAARIFRKFLVEPAEDSVYVKLDETTEKNLLYQNKAWSIGNPETYGSKKALAKICKLGIYLERTTPESFIEKAWECSAYNKLANPNNQLYWNTKEGIFAVLNDKLSLTITSPGITETDLSLVSKDFISKGFMNPFQSSGDFAVFTAIKEKDHAIAYSCRWTGNKGEKLREYGKSFTGKDSSALLMTRDEINLTTIPVYQTREAQVLNSEGTIKNQNKLNCYTLNVKGKKSKTVSGSGTDQLNFTADDQTLWYLFEY